MAKKTGKGVIKTAAMFFWVVLTGAWFSGATMALLNFLVELTIRESVFRMHDFLLIFGWHLFMWTFMGILISLIFYMIPPLRRNICQFNISQIAMFGIYIGLFLAVAGYFNYYVFPLALSKQGLFWNFLLLSIGFLLFFIAFLFIRRWKNKSIGYLIKGYGLFLISFLIISLVCNLVPSKKPVHSPSSLKHLPNAKNVILILIDAVRPDHLGCYGYSKNTSPNIDMLAANGVVFKNAFAQSSRTQESVPSLLTATYPIKHNMNKLTSVLPEPLITIPQVFQNNGYNTSIFSIHPNITPQFGFNRGVENFFCLQRSRIRNTLLYLILEKTQALPGVRILSSFFLETSKTVFPVKNTLKLNDPKVITDKVISWINEKKKNPFFIYMHYIGAHSPYTPPPPFNKMFDSSQSERTVTEYPLSHGIFLPFRKGTPIQETSRLNMIAQYDGEIRYHDQQIGRLIKHLENIGLLKETIIVITSDHGEEFFEHEGWGHGHSLYDEVIRIPLIFSCPEFISAKEEETLAASIDIFPTLIEICNLPNGFEFDYKIDGLALSSAVLGKEPRIQRKSVIATVDHGGHSAACLRTLDYKFIKVCFGNQTAQFLFSLQDDYFEKNNILKDEQDIGTQMLNELNIIMNKSEGFKSKNTQLDEETIKRLKTLGYIK